MIFIFVRRIYHFEIYRKYTYIVGYYKIYLYDL